MKDFISFLKEWDIDFEENVEGKKLCSFKVGGNVRVVVKPKKADEIEALYGYMLENDIKNVLLCIA